MILISGFAPLKRALFLTALFVCFCAVVVMATEDTAAPVPEDGIHENAPVPAYSANEFDAPAREVEEVPDQMNMAMRMVAALVLVLGILLLFYTSLKRFVNSRGTLPGKAAMIQVLATRYLGSKNSLSVIDVGGRQFVIGVSQQGISFLTHLQDGSLDVQGNHDVSAFQKILRGKLTHG
jgi:flagellar biosynthetic protein FliO